MTTTAAVFGYQGTPGGPSDPSTPGSYCLAICRCGTCPQYVEQQRRAGRQREQEHAARVRLDGERAERKRKHGTSTKKVDDDPVRDRFFDVIAQLVARGEPFSANDARPDLPALPANRTGALWNAADTAEPRLAFWEVRETGSLDHPQEVAP